MLQHFRPASLTRSQGTIGSSARRPPAGYYFLCDCERVQDTARAIAASEPRTFVPEIRQRHQ
jgi:hypothetical protein